MLEWSTACPDWERRIAAGESLLPRLPLDQDRAAKALRIFKRLRVVDIPGKPTLGEVCAPWVFEFVEAIFGAFDAETRRQLIREFFLFVAKKNAKSTLAAGVMLTALIMNERHAGEYLILAPTKDVADNSFIPAYEMVKADRALLARYKPSDTTREIINRLDGSVLAVKSADADVVGGQKAIAVFVDELWLFGKKASAKNILSEATGSLASRPEGFVIYASTQSDDPPAGVFKEKLHYHRDVRDGKRIDRTCLPLIYEYPEAMMKAEAWHDRSTWHIPNPSLGRSVDPEFLASELAKKDAEGRDSLRLFLAKHFNVEIGIGLRTDGWPGAKYWAGAAESELAAHSHFEALNVLLDRSEAVVVGIDGGGLDDLFGMCVLGREPTEVVITANVAGIRVTQKTKRWLAWSHAWCHKGVLELRKSIASKLEEFAAARELDIVEDELGDLGAIVEIVQRIKDRRLLAGVAVDPAGLGELVTELKAIDVTEQNKLLVGIGQGFRMMNAIKTAERKLANGTLRHCGGVMMPWCVDNLKIEPTATAIRATKASAGDRKIDPAMAMFDAVDLMTTNPVSAPKYQAFFIG